MKQFHFWGFTLQVYLNTCKMTYVEDIHCMMICNSKRLETTYMCISRELVEQTVVFLQHIYLSKRKTAIFMLFVIEWEMLPRCKN